MIQNYIIPENISIPVSGDMVLASNNEEIISSLPNFPGLCSNVATGEVSSEEASVSSSPLPILTNVDTNPKRKQIKKTPNNQIQQVNNVLLSYIDFYKQNVCLHKYKLPELKTLAKFHKLHISGTKSILVDRILKHFHLNISAIKIQKNLRVFFVKRSFQLRGQAFKNQSLCVNSTDFFTLEPLDEIPFQEFFSYTDTSNFTYGFNIQSLMSLLKRKGRSIINPYNRTKIPEIVIGNMIRLYLYIIILFPDNVGDEEKIPTSRNTYLQPLNISLLLRGYYYGFPFKTPIRAPVNPLPGMTRVDEQYRYRIHANTNDVIPQNTFIVEAPAYNQRVLPPSLMTLHNIEDNDNHVRQIRRRILEIRSKPLDARISELFMEIDQLGNYTNVEWFTSLQKHELLVFLNQLHELWRYRARLSFQYKTRICPLGDPFIASSMPRHPHNDYSIEQITAFCMNAMESLVFTASDIEDRKLGAMYVLIALTYVSVPAHNNLPWLFESMY
jgi:hypothetical protein